MDMSSISEMAKKIRSGDPRATAQGISLIEDGVSGSDHLLDLLSADVGNAFRIGITGAPGSGKSSLVTALTEKFIEENRQIGIVAVDPSSPFSGGALLGDRIRMGDIRHPNVFIRSMASRGHSGGLAPTSLQVCDTLDASGKDLLIVETVGTGQSDVDVKDLVDTTVLVLTPESGDSIQAMKAGIMEIGDIIVINKKDRGGADRIEQELRSMFQMRRAQTTDDPEQPDEIDEPIIQTSARDEENIDVLFEQIQKKWAAHDRGTPEDHTTREKRRKQLTLILNSRLKTEMAQNERVQSLTNSALDKIEDGQLSPYGAARDILRELGLLTEEHEPS